MGREPLPDLAAPTSTVRGNSSIRSASGADASAFGEEEVLAPGALGHIAETIRSSAAACGERCTMKQVAITVCPFAVSLGGAALAKAEEIEMSGRATDC